MSLTDGIRPLESFELENQRVLIRVDFDVPLEDDTVVDDSRIRDALPTIRYAMEKGARVILASHASRPAKGNRGPQSLEPAGMRLSELSGFEVQLPEEAVGDAPRKLIGDLRPGQVILLENLGGHEGEDGNDPAFARQLADQCDVYVNDAVRTLASRRASTYALPRMLRERTAGLALMRELTAIETVRTAKPEGFVAIVGGEKASDKMSLVNALIGRVAVLALGGGVANTFLAASGRPMKGSPIETDRLAAARSLLSKARDTHVQVILPTDVVVAASARGESTKTTDLRGLSDTDIVFDIGPATAERIAKALAFAQTIFWNGPLGAVEKTGFAAGTQRVAKELAQASGAFTFVTGGDTTKVLRLLGDETVAPIKHVSLGDEVTLAILEGRKLPGLDALRT